METIIKKWLLTAFIVSGIFFFLITIFPSSDFYEKPILFSDNESKQNSINALDKLSVNLENGLRIGDVSIESVPKIILKRVISPMLVGSGGPTLSREQRTEEPSDSSILRILDSESSTKLSIRLKIPNINVNAAVESVGITSDGAMDVPKSPADVAWFELGRRPGEEGTAVMSGHYGWKNNTPAVFDNLHTLKKGDRVYVEDEKGEVITFVVRESRMYDPEAGASDVFGSNDGKAHLNLITCEGVWDKVSKTYSKRLVVFTDKE